VASRRLAILALLRRLWVHRLFMATISQQQQISPLFSMIPQFSSPDHYLSGISTLLMSEELAQDEEDAEDYDLDTIERQTDSVLRRREDDEATLVGGRGGVASMNEDSVVFEIGDEDAHDLSDDDDAHKSRHTSIEHVRDEGDDNADERVGFLNGGPRSRRRDD
jgi:hypothetical protein